MMEVFCFQLIASLIITKSSALSGMLDRSVTPDELYSLLVSAIWDSLWDMLWPMRYATSYQLFVSIDMFYHISYGQSYELWVVYSVCMICHMRCNMSYIAIWGNISTGDPIQLPNFTPYWCIDVHCSISSSDSCCPSARCGRAGPAPAWTQWTVWTPAWWHSSSHVM